MSHCSNTASSPINASKALSRNSSASKSGSAESPNKMSSNSSEIPPMGMSSSAYSGSGSQMPLCMPTLVLRRRPSAARAGPNSAAGSGGRRRNDMGDPSTASWRCFPTLCLSDTASIGASWDNRPPTGNPDCTAPLAALPDADASSSAVARGLCFPKAAALRSAVRRAEAALMNSNSTRPWGIAGALRGCRRMWKTGAARTET
mmetsp:Transcript_23600/g.67645  ORF Transcript_23600/g.67645 Transcript_23600/m.67645 type:complete len:203 (-) Transcript_23600:3-611(-)